MKKFFMFLAVAGVLTFTANIASAQDQPEADNAAATEQVETAAAQPMTAEDLLKGTGEDVPMHQQIKTYFIQGGPGFMSMILLCLIIGLALAIERILYLSFSKTNTKKLLKNVESALAQGGVEKAKAVCRDTKGPVASIFYDGLNHYDEGLDVVEKRITSAGGVSWRTTSLGSLCSSHLLLHSDSWERLSVWYRPSTPSRLLVTSPLTSLPEV